MNRRELYKKEYCVFMGMKLSYKGYKVLRIILPTLAYLLFLIIPSIALYNLLRHHPIHNIETIKEMLIMIVGDFALYLLYVNFCAFFFHFIDHPVDNEKLPE